MIIQLNIALLDGVKQNSLRKKSLRRRRRQRRAFTVQRVKEKVARVNRAEVR